MTTVITVCRRMIGRSRARPPATISAATTTRATTLVTGATAPAEPFEHGGRGQRGQDGQHGLPADREQPGDRGRQPVAAHAERGPAEHHRRRRAALAGQRDEAAEQEREDDADDPGEQRPARRRCRSRARTRRSSGRGSRRSPPNHGQNSSAGRPLRSSSAMTLMPLVSTARRASGRSSVTPDLGHARPPGAQWSAGRMWYSNTRPPMASSRMTTEMVIAQTRKKASEMASSAAEPARVIGQ